MAKTKEKVCAVVLTGGVGRRVRMKDLPKQFCLVKGKPVFVHALSLYEGMESVDDVCLVINPSFHAEYKKVTGKYKFRKISKTVSGGKFRHESIAAAVSAMRDADYFIIHNGVNPTVDPSLAERCLEEAKRHGASVACTPAFHTVLTFKENSLSGVLDRKKLCYSTDPMVFRASLLREMLETAKKLGWERDIPMLELAIQKGHAVRMVEAPQTNMKLTFPHDLAALESVLKTQ